MARKPSFAALEEPKAAPPPPVAIEADSGAGGDDQPMLPMAAPKVAKVRRGKKIIAGYFPPELAKAVRLLAVEQDSTVEAMLGEAINLLLRHHGKHPERAR